MADHAAQAPTSAGTTLTERTGTASSDTVPAGSKVIVRNTGVGAHNMTFTVGYTFDGLSVASRVVAIAAGAAVAINVPANYGNANGLVPVSIDGTASEVKYWVVS